MWIRFSKPWDWRQPGFTIAYLVGDFNVTRACADAALAAGVGARLRKTNKDEAPWPSDRELAA